jgi:hypothetical protein
VDHRSPLSIYQYHFFKSLSSSAGGFSIGRRKISHLSSCCILSSPSVFDWTTSLAKSGAGLKLPHSSGDKENIIRQLNDIKHSLLTVNTTLTKILNEMEKKEE